MSVAFCLPQKNGGCTPRNERMNRNQLFQLVTATVTKEFDSDNRATLSGLWNHDSGIVTDYWKHHIDSCSSQTTEVHVTINRTTAVQSDSCNSRTNYCTSFTHGSIYLVVYFLFLLLFSCSQKKLRATILILLSWISLFVCFVPSESADDWLIIIQVQYSYIALMIFPDCI